MDEIAEEVKGPEKEAYEDKQIIGETGSPEVEAEKEEVKSELKKQPPNPNLRFKAIVLFDTRINETFDDLVMPPQYQHSRAMFVKKGRIDAIHWDKIIRVITTQLEIDEKHPDYIKPEVVDGQK